MIKVTVHDDLSSKYKL